MSDPEIVDEINIDVVDRLLNKSDHPHMATCPGDGEPLICTLRFSGAEFYCMVCHRLYGFLSPQPAPWSEELQARHDELADQFSKKFPT